VKMGVHSRYAEAEGCVSTRVPVRQLTVQWGWAVGTSAFNTLVNLYVVDYYEKNCT
jgi:hypothetical protein